MSRKALIVTEGGKKIGFGHIARCISLCQAFEEKGITPRFVINGDSTISGLLEGRECQIFNWLRAEKRLLRLVSDTDIVVIDSYLAKKKLYDKIAKAGDKCLLVMIDDYKRIDYPEGIVINPSIYGDKLDYLKKKGARYLLGKDYIIVRREFWEVPRKIIAKRLQSVLITFGGTNYNGLICKTASFLKKRFDLTVNVIEPLKKLISAKNVQALMFRCDVCLSGSGQMVYELARIGVPDIGICLSENQRMNAEIWQKKGFMEGIGSGENKNLLKNLESAVKKLSDRGTRLRMSRVGRKLVDGQGPRRIIGEVLKYADKN